MKKMIIIGTMFLVLPLISRADAMNPDWLTKHCPIGQIEIECSYSNKEPGILNKFNNGCARYENSPNYEYLTGHGSTWGGSQRFCLVIKDDNTFLKLTLLAIATSILSLLGLIKLRKKNVSNNNN